MDNFKKAKKFIMYHSEWTDGDIKLTCCYDIYAMGGIFLELYEKDENDNYECFMTASICVPCALEDNEIAIKNYSENEGILDILIEQGVINEPHRYVSSGYVNNIPVCTLKEVQD